MKKINIININSKYSMMHPSLGIVPDWAEEVSVDFFKFLENRFPKISKVADCEPF
jgi:hypothetical protein